MSKVIIDTELLDQLNKGLANKDEAFTTINKASTEEKIEEIKPIDIVGEPFNAKDWCGDPGDESEGTIAGCINLLAREMAEFVEGVILVDEGEESYEDSESHHHSGGSYYSTPTTEETPVIETPTVVEAAPETPAVPEPEVIGEEVTVTPIVIDPAVIATEFTQDGEGKANADGIGTVTIIQDGIIVTNGNGEQVGTTGVGQYKVYEQMSDENGNVIAVRISKDGEEEQWIQMIQNGNQVGTFYETNQVGSFTCMDAQVVIFDANGNPVGTLTQGYHKVYAINTDNNGNVTAIRISKDGEEEQWVQIYENGKYIDGGTFEQYGQQYTNPQTFDNGQGTQASVYGKRNKILGGVLGVLVVGLGATIYVKKKKENENGTVEVEETLPEGDYDIYDYKTDDDGNLTSAKISSDDSAEEQWVEF